MAGSIRPDTEQEHQSRNRSQEKRYKKNRPETEALLFATVGQERTRTTPKRHEIARHDPEGDQHECGRGIHSYPPAAFVVVLGIGPSNLVGSLAGARNAGKN